MEPKANYYKLLGLLESLALKVDDIYKKLDEIRTEHVAETRSSIAVIQSKLSRLEWIVYGFAGISTMEAVALIFSYIKHG